MTRSSSRLSPRDLAIIQTVTRHRQIESHQLRRLYFEDGSPASRGVRQRKALARLVKWGEIQRLPRPVGGYSGGSGAHVYLPMTSKARHPDAHTLDLTELYVRLVESGQLNRFDPEPWCHINVGHVELKPDATVKTQTPRGTFNAFVEMDRSTEWRSQLAAKMRRYCTAYEKWKGSTFPQVVFIVHDQDRLRLIRDLGKRQEVQLFKTVLFEDAVAYLTGVGSG